MDKHAISLIKGGARPEFIREEWEWDSSIRRLTSLSSLRPVDDGTGPRDDGTGPRQWDSDINWFKPRPPAPRSGPPQRAEAPHSGPSGEHQGGSPVLETLKRLKIS
jgi:hypothetical protein